MIYKKGRYYMAKFMWEGKVIRKSTRCASAKDARTVEGTIRSQLAKGNFGILEFKPRLTLAEFLKGDFLPFVETEFQTKPNSRDYYRYATAGPVAPSIHSASITSGLYCPIFVMSLTSPQTLSGGALTWRLTSARMPSDLSLDHSCGLWRDGPSLVDRSVESMMAV